MNLEPQPLPNGLSAPGAASGDAWLFGTDPTPGIVSVWAERDGRALVWRRVDGTLVCERERFRPWVFADSLLDFEQLEPSERAAVTVSELEGQGYRFLLEADDGRALERAILAGASRRLGHEVRRVNDLEAYFQYGPVDQYLMRSGRAYFRGLAFADLHRLQFDLETTALEASQGRVFMVAVRDSSGFETVLEAPTERDEAGLIRALCDLVRERDPDVLENHNLMGFDLPFLQGRAAALGVRLELGRRPGPTGLVSIQGRREARFSLAGRELLDTMDAVWRHDFVARDMPSHRLKDVARYFGVASPDREYIAGADVAQTYFADPERVRRYALDDVREVDAISQRLHAPAFALAGMAPRRFERVAYAGTATGILEPMLVRAYLHAGVALPKSQDPPNLGPHSGGGLELFATGIAERVVKADIASLYPSIIRAYGINPACDHLGVFHALVERLTVLRLEHKRAAKRGDPASLEAGHHHALQAAMKLIINSAYGYLGAGRMALFADRRAADEITRRGRGVLEQVVNGLHARGVALIEADTDGVYFAVPEGWDEGREREPVREVAATLPEGLTLEFDGRYRAMFSHEVKNYALLGYDGKLTVRGGALHSSRSEPFGERFLHEALRRLLHGDVTGVREVFLETAHKLRSRAFAAKDVAVRARLTKSPEKYLASRSKLREAVYEALLGSGQSEWRAGDKVRFYRATGGRSVLVPDEALEERADLDVQLYLDLLVGTYAARLRKAFAPGDFERLFRLEGQDGLFDTPIEHIEPVRISVYAHGG